MKFKFAFAVACLATSALAQAQSAGSLVVYAGAAQIKPEVDSGDLSAPSLPGTKIDVKKASQFVGGLTYYWTDNISIDLPIGPAFKHDVVGAGAIASAGKIGDVHALPVTLLGQYRFGDAKSMLRPFVGAGFTYARFYKPKSTAVLTAITGGLPSNPTLLSMKSAAGPTLQLGVAVNLTPQISADLAFTKTFLKTTGHLSTGQSIDATLDPTAIRVGIGYQF